MNLRPEDFRAGEPLPARELNAIREEVARLGRISFVPPLGGSSDGAGVTIWHSNLWSGWVKITGGGTGGKYSWKAQVATTGGTWADLPGNLNGSTTVDPLYEANLNASVPLSPAPIVWASRIPETGILTFQSGSCS